MYTNTNSASNRTTNGLPPLGNCIYLDYPLATGLHSVGLLFWMTLFILCARQGIEHGRVLLGGCGGLMVHYPCVTCYTRLAGAQIEEEMTIGSDGRQNEIWPCPYS